MGVIRRLRLRLLSTCLQEQSSSWPVTADRDWLSPDVNWVRQNGFLSYPPRPYAILFIIAGSLVHDVKGILVPCWQILVIQFYCSLRYGRKCAKSGSSGKVDGDCLFSWNIISQVRLLGLKEISRDFDNYLALMSHRHRGCPDFLGEFELDVQKLLIHWFRSTPWTYRMRVDSTQNPTRLDFQSWPGFNITLVIRNEVLLLNTRYRMLVGARYAPKRVWQCASWQPGRHFLRAASRAAPRVWLGVPLVWEAVSAMARAFDSSLPNNLRRLFVPHPDKDAVPKLVALLHSTNAS
jgi:hypothetical protein